MSPDLKSRVHFAGLELELDHPKIESLFKSAYSCNAVAPTHIMSEAIFLF